MSKTNREHTPAFQAQVALAAIEGDQTISGDEYIGRLQVELAFGIKIPRMIATRSGDASPPIIPSRTFVGRVSGLSCRAPASYHRPAEVEPEELALMARTAGIVNAICWHPLTRPIAATGVCLRRRFRPQSLHGPFPPFEG